VPLCVRGVVYSKFESFRATAVTALWWPASSGWEIEPQQGYKIQTVLTIVLLDAVSRADIPQLDAVIRRGCDEVPNTVCEYEAKCGW
jgi:hypothetical protein